MQKKIKSSGLKPKVEELIKVLQINPYTNNPAYEKLLGDLKGAYSRRINIQHRLIYEIFDKEKIVKVIKLWTHYK